MNLAFMVLCAGLVGVYLSKEKRSPTDNFTLGLNILAVIANLVVIARALPQ